MSCRFLPQSALALALISPVTHAFDARDCSIWLCLPFGFPSGCGEAKDAFKDRIMDFKSPLPRLDKCLLKSDTPLAQGATSPSMTSKEGIAAYIPQRRECQHYEIRHQGSKHREKVCVEWKTLPPQAIKNVRCRVSDTSSTPKHCTRTIRYVDFFMDGKPYQETRYYSSKGNLINIP